MTNENTCDAVNSDFYSYLYEHGYDSLKTSEFFAFGTKIRPFGICVTEQDKGSVKCQNEPFSDFAV